MSSDAKLCRHAGKAGDLVIGCNGFGTQDKTKVRVSIRVISFQ